MQKTHDTLALRLRAAREALGLSARAVDALAGLATGHCSYIENGLRENIGVQTAVALSRAVHVSLEWLVLGEGIGPTDTE